MIIKRLMIVLLLLVSFFQSLYADCVYGAKDKISFQALDSNTIILIGGYGGSILIKTYCYLYSSLTVQVLKNDFCDYESSVLYIDGNVCDANQVKKLD